MHFPAAQPVKRPWLVFVLLFVPTIAFLIAFVRLRRSSKRAAGSALVAFLSWSMLNCASPSHAAASAVGRNEILMEYHCGRVYGPTNVVVRTNLALAMQKQITNITTSCSCTVADLKAGDIIGSNSMVTVVIRADEGESTGLFRQVVLADTADGARLVLGIDFEYVPPPFHQPAALVYSDLAKVRDMVLYFRDESAVKVTDVESPKRMFNLREVDRKESFVKLQIGLMESYQGERLGKLKLRTTSTNLPLIEVPYWIDDGSMGTVKK